MNWRRRVIIPGTIATAIVILLFLLTRLDWGWVTAPPKHTQEANEHCAEYAERQDAEGWRRFSVAAGRHSRQHVCHVYLPDGTINEYIVGDYD